MASNGLKMLLVGKDCEEFKEDVAVATVSPRDLDFSRGKRYDLYLLFDGGVDIAHGLKSWRDHFLNYVVYVKPFREEVR